METLPSKNEELAVIEELWWTGVDLAEAALVREVDYWSRVRTRVVNSQGGHTGVRRFVVGLFCVSPHPCVKVFLHGLAWFAGGLAGDDVDDACFPVELLPHEVEDVA